jgi:hypothetical protein
MTSEVNHIADKPPSAEHVTDYDRRQFKTYARLLDAAVEQADWQEVADRVLGLNVTSDPEHARRVYDAHLERARWMTTNGYRDLLGDGSPSRL